MKKLKQMPRVIVVSNFHEDNSISRSNLAFQYFSSKGYEVQVLYSTFSHSLKKHRILKNKRFIPISTIAYYSSFSINRLLSYLIFSVRVYLYLRKNSADIIYFNIPPNIVALACLWTKKTRTKIIIDIIDLWPESFPAKNKIIKYFIGLASILFSRIRMYAIKKSDFCILESQYFHEALKLSSHQNTKIIHLKKFFRTDIIEHLPDKIFTIVYLGNIGNIYDFESLFKIIKSLEEQRPVKLRILGDGPRRDWLVNRLSKLNINFRDFGASFDEKVKEEIIGDCWFGYNGFLASSQVGLSYKSVDYLSYGVPLLNTVKLDTFNLVEKEKIGFNFNEENLDSLINKLAKISYEEITSMKRKSHSVFKKNFSGDSYHYEMDSVIEGIGLQ